MGFLESGIEEFLGDWIDQDDAVLAAMEEEARERSFPIVGPEVGRFLAQLVLLSRARRILEMGSGFGYSALWMARYLPSGGRVIQTENDPDNVDRSREYFQRAGCEDRTEWHLGDAMEIVSGLEGGFDLVLIDVEKSRYPAAFEQVRDRLNPGGLLVVDNALWRGQVANPNFQDSSTLGVRKLLEAVASDRALLCSLLPLRDGVLVALRR
ncbi:MAG: O-methyltransferase [Planctomycetota bacterium]|jgi:predicted O-methyltransferase YrrM|nr:O-methyltransferase [Planctomycetota bacterium]